MKRNKSLLIALTAGLAVAGLVGLLLTTDTGRNITKKWKIRGGTLANSVEDIIGDAKKKFANLNKEMLSECKKTPEVMEQP